jgi:hypothetical protein
MHPMEGIRRLARFPGIENCYLMPLMEGIWRLSRFTDFGGLFGEDVTVGKVF